MRRMYHQYFGLSEAPFSIAVNPRYLFMSARHRDALAHLLYGVGAGGGFILLTGEVGTGKTTINRCLLEQLPDDTDIAIILNPALNAIELLASVCDELGIEHDGGAHTLKSLTDKLHRFLLDNHARGRKTVLMIDEAQHLDFEVLEQIRLLTNLETNSQKLLQIILIGQPELAQLLARPELRQLNQRITARYNLGALNLAETRSYIQHRLQVAGMAPDREIFPAAVVRGIYRRTRGIPRLINVLCDRILLGAYGRNRSRADMQTLRQAAREVLGEDAEADKGSGWPLTAAVLILFLGLIGAWWFTVGKASVVGARSAGDPAPVGARSAGDPVTVATPSADDEIASRAERAPTIAPVGARYTGDQSTAPVAALAAGDESESRAERAPATAQSWLLPPADAEALLWSTATPRPLPDDLCADPSGELACVEGKAQTWDELAALKRPLLLDTVTPQRFAAGVVLLDMSGRSAWVALEDGAEKVDLAVIAPLWQGSYRFLWRPPAGYERPLAQGDKGPAVAAVANLFARLDGQQRPLTGQSFNEALRQRVEIFQRAHGLEADGVVGVRTLLELNQALGLDPSAEEARVAMVDAAHGAVN